MVWNRKLYRYPKSDDLFVDESGRNYRVTYLHGPARVNAQLTVHIESGTPSRTPVFRGAWLENVPTRAEDQTDYIETGRTWASIQTTWASEKATWENA